MSLLEQHFDVAFAAPDGIKKLRELILTLAMQGKLVPQDPNDEPASELLRSIEAEKQWLLKEGKIKQSKPLPEIKSEEVPYKLPKNWEWVRLGELINLISGQHLTVNEYNENGDGIPYYTGPADFGIRNPTSIRWTFAERAVATEGDILLTVKGAGVGKTNVLDNSKAAISRQLMALQAIAINKEFLHLFLKTIFNDLQRLATGIAIPGIGREDVLMQRFPLPPLAEQRRIVAKIDQLMARCDELEKLRIDRSQRLLTVHTAALDRLLTVRLRSPQAAKDSSEFSTAWSFITQHFGELYSVKENVVELRKTILQLAVMGKLVPQDPNDEPASELLGSIELEKQRLVKEGKIKQPKPLPEIKPEEVPYVLPDSWRWVRLGEIVSLLGDGLHGTPTYDETGDYFFINGNNLSDGSIEIKGNTNRVSVDEYHKYKKELNSRTVLVSINGTIGNVAFYNNENVILGKSACYFNLFERIDKQFIKKLINSIYFLEYAFSSATGSTIKNVSLKSMREFSIPLPPLAEQGRIVEKIDRLMGMCDRLEESIESAKGKQTALLNALMSQV